MLFSSRCSALSRSAAVVALLASLGNATPTPVDVSIGKPVNDLVFREALELAHTPHLEKRLSADFNMDKTWDNDVLFAGSWMNSDGNAAESVSLSVTCVECYTKGTVTATLTDEDIIDPSVRLDFSGVEAYVDIELAMSAGATYAVNLFTSQTPIGLGFPGLSVGVVFYLDLVFSLTEEIDLEGGFYVKLADGAYLEASVFGGDITKSFFDGLSSKSLPVTVKSGMATFKADLRLRVQCGAEADIDIFGIGAGAELGIYANLIEFVAVLDSTPTCELQSLEWFDLNVGAFANLDVVVDYRTIGAIPTVSTTLLTAPTLTQCWIQGGSPSESGGAGSTISVSASLPPAESDTETLSVSVPSVTSAPQGSAAASSAGPGNPSVGSSGGDVLVTSTLYSTTTFTITSCAASVVNCPASYASEIVVTRTVDIYTTVCPVTASITSPSASSSAAAASSAVATAYVITDVVVLVPCSSAITETFTPPGSPAGATATTNPAAAVPAVQQEVTASAVPTPARSVASTAALTTVASPSSSPFVGAVGEKQAQWSNSTSCSTTLSMAYGTGQSGVTTTTASPAFATAGAAGSSIQRGLVVLAAVFGGLMLM